MLPGNSSDTQYAEVYARLQIDYTSEWPVVRARYRHLVNRWHPDKFPANSREKHYAQQHFIDLTKSYTTLRNYYRKNGQLPYQKQRSRPESTAGVRHSPGVGSSDREVWPHGNGETGNTVFSGTGTIRHSGQRNFEARSVRWWVVSSALIILTTAAILLLQDMRATNATLEQAREALEHTPTSEFAPDSSEIRKVELRKGLLKQPGY